MSPTLQALQSLHDYGSAREHVFPSRSSLEWFVRVHRRHLIEQGALLVICGRRMVNPDVFDTVVLRVGQQSAARPGEGEA